MTKVVFLTELNDQVVQIQLEDRQGKNMFSLEIADQLADSFNEVSKNERYKAVILTGYDTYFASGGTKDGLLSIFEGKGKFTDKDLYSLALNCPIPVIGAMQGHGIGGGFVLGMFSDFPILSRESVYTANFMKYGFTPGMGATLVLPHKLGLPLAQEMLMNAANFRGEELKQRGVAFPVLPRAKVLDYAKEIAHSLAEKPRVSLVALKDQLVRSLREQLPEVVKQEVAMHDITFLQPEVKRNIEILFGS